MKNIDPVCGMEVTEEKYTFYYKGKKYYFCSEGCMSDFNCKREAHAKDKRYELVIIGGGPAGLTAAVYAAVQNIKTFLITKNIGGQAIESSMVKNYLGFDFITGKELINKFEKQFLHKHYLQHKLDEVLKISKDGSFYNIVTVGGKSIVSRSIIIASGMKSRTLGIPGEKQFLRKGVSYSSVQELELFAGMDVVVVGGGNSGIQTAYELRGIAKQTTLVSDLALSGDADDIRELRKIKNIRIMEYSRVIEICGKERVEQVIVQKKSDLSREQIPCNGVFIQIGFMPNTEFCKGLTDLNERGEIIINKDCSTSARGIYACGDVTDTPEKRIIISAGEGAKAALNAKKFLRTG